MAATVTVDISKVDVGLSHNEEQVLFYYHLGRTITQWASIEIALSQLFVACMHPKARAAAQSAFFAIENFRSKLQATQNAVWAKTFRRKALWIDWVGSDKEIGLEERIRSASGIRNQLVHFMVINFQGKPGRRVNLRPNIFNPRNPPMPPAQAPQGGYFVGDFVPIVERFFAVHQAIENFEASIRRRKGRHPGFDIRVPRPKKSEPPAPQTRAVRAIPPSPSRR